MLGPLALWDSWDLERNERCWPVFSTWNHTQSAGGLQKFFSPLTPSLFWMISGKRVKLPFSVWIVPYFPAQVIGFCSLLSAPNSTPQNIHVIQRDPGLILEWEGVAPDVLKESVLGYRLEWIQDNVTQVTGWEGTEPLNPELQKVHTKFSRH